MKLTDWLKERRANCSAIAGTKTGKDRSMWLEDAVYFQATLDALDAARRVLSDIDEGRRGAGRCLDHLPARGVDTLRLALAFEGTDLATGPVELDAVCRRCTTCEGMRHHWIEDPDEDDPDAPDYACKHCDARGVECEVCDGDGTDEDGELCAVCNTEGVIRAEVAAIIAAEKRG
jgi:hypothetical protein